MKSSPRTQRRFHENRKTINAIERLEIRRLLATFTWDAGGAGGTFSDPDNWEGINEPPVGSDIVLPNLGFKYVVKMDGLAPNALNSIRVDSGADVELDLAGRNIQLTRP